MLSSACLLNDCVNIFNACKKQKAFLFTLHYEIFLQVFRDIDLGDQPVVPWMNLIGTEQRTY